MFNVNPSFALQGNGGQSWLLQTARLNLQAVDNIRKLRLQARPGAELNTTPLERLTGSVLPAGPQEKVDNEFSAYWLAPNDWLLVNPASDIDSIGSALQDSSNEVTYVVTDLTDAYSIIDISGEDAVARLAEGCSVDLDGKRISLRSLCIDPFCNTCQSLSIAWMILPRFRVLVDRKRGALSPGLVDCAIPGGFVVR